MWGFQKSSWSMITPQNFISDSLSILTPSKDILTFYCIWFPKTIHFTYITYILLKYNDIYISVFHVQKKKKIVSSANKTNCNIFDSSQMFLIYKRKSLGPKTHPCSTPQLTFILSDLLPAYCTYCRLLFRELLNHLWSVPLMPYAHSLESNMSCSIVSNVFFKSINTPNMHFLFSIVVVISSVHSINTKDADMLFPNPCWFSLNN